jgi:hypothetical protein
MSIKYPYFAAYLRENADDPVKSTYMLLENETFEKQ